MGQRHTSPLCPCPRTCQSWLKELTSARGLTQRRMGSKANPGTVSGPSRSPRKKKVTYAQESAGDFFPLSPLDLTYDIDVASIFLFWTYLGKIS